jgi:hypothetical protein
LARYCEEIREQRANSREQRTGSREQRTESRLNRAKNRKLRARSRKSIIYIAEKKQKLAENVGSEKRVEKPTGCRRQQNTEILVAKPTGKATTL